MTSSHHGPYVSRAGYMLQWPVQRVVPSREADQIPKSRPHFGLEAETHLHEAEIASNRGSAIVFKG
ncbi:MAG: hypothetical protein E3K32_11245 [wastewater metagenome]|nr:hypothetical protein [Candidatus Loosdrechtia aerotolerans]